MEPPSSTSHVHARNVAGPENPASAGFFPSCAFEETPEILIEDRRWHCYVPRPEQVIRRALAACEAMAASPAVLCSQQTAWCAFSTGSIAASTAPPMF